MGGHGGLNILPQKRWNVYNYSNRLQVERDRQKVEVKDRRKDEEESKSVGQLRLDILKRKQQRAEKKEKKCENKKPNALTQEFAQIVKQNKNFNLFTEEEKYNEEKEESRAKFEKEQKLKEEEEPKPYDASTKFLGRQRENQANAWYLKHSGEEVKDTSWIKNRRRQWGNIKEKGNELEESINDFHKQSENYYKVLECKVEKKVKVVDDKTAKTTEQYKEKDVVFNDLETMLKEKLQRKQEKKEKKRLKKLEKKLKKMEKKRDKQEFEEQKNRDKQEFEEQEAKEKKKKLRQERLQREAVERQREKELFQKKFPFEFQY